MIKRPVSKSEREKGAKKKKSRKTDGTFLPLYTHGAVCFKVRIHFIHTDARQEETANIRRRRRRRRRIESERAKEEKKNVQATKSNRSFLSSSFVDVVYLLFREGQLHQWPLFWHTPSDIPKSSKDKKTKARRKESGISDRKTCLSFSYDYDERLTSCSRAGRCQRMCGYLPPVVTTICYHD